MEFDNFLIRSFILSYLVMLELSNHPLVKPSLINIVLLYPLKLSWFVKISDIEGYAFFVEIKV